MEKQGGTLKRIEVNLCYEVGITQFARISCFLFAADTFIATLLAWRPRLATERSVCDAPPSSLDTLCYDARCASTPGSRSFAAVRVSASTPGRANIPASSPILLCHAASQLIACMIVLRAGRSAYGCAQPALNECVFSATLHKNILFQFALMFSQIPPSMRGSTRRPPMHPRAWPVSQVPHFFLLNASRH